MLPSPPMRATRRISVTFLCAAILCHIAFWSSHALAGPQAPLNVVVTIPVLKDLTEQVGGPYVHVTSLLSGYENEHTYAPKPTAMRGVAAPVSLFTAGNSFIA